MTAWVLLLAGVTAGDGGQRMGAATAPLTEPLRLDFSREWEGGLQIGGVTYPVRLSRGEMTLFLRRPVTQPLTLTLSPGGQARGSWGQDRFHGTHRVEGDRLLVRFTPADPARPAAFTAQGGYVLTLKPAARRP
jgi:hypothetical protein